MEDFILLLKYAFFGFVQGITEPIPISSSGHMVFAEKILDIHIEGFSFEVFMNFASLLAVLVIYREDLVRLTTNGLNFTMTRDRKYKSDFMFIIYLIIGTIPAAVIGILAEDFISKNLKDIKVVGASLIVTGIALWLIRNLRGRKYDQDLSIKDALIVGLAQAVALIPGISRSGATIVAAMGRGMKQETALRYSFLLYIPVSIGTMVLSFSDLKDDPLLDQLLIPYLVAFLISFIASYISLKWLIGIMARGNLKYFAIYCFIVGPLVILFM
ncbi:undecaprenyl-diphosphate phosphatase [Pseudalkalibacillus salsuginis]|uniref:undecaprenyl-diphosphate phosphatase n=1 Tax=Pseudalkalibacillus salsuginis TaxID=2910972 RepID=UPI001F376C34|nr:undecaprenyl-diphosphate phosphatase [Pseudalkalibacillus salsuginis]MCF6409221.1 undecaprenyl-diphosphate phosphatase [Pseudalkalibacillus salsuginis]